MDEIVMKLKALADKNRLEIVRLLLNDNFCVGALAGQLNISKAAVSQHMQVLRKAGIVIGEKHGYWTHYVVQKDILKDVGNDLIQLAASEQKHSCADECTQRCEKVKVAGNMK